MSINKSTEELNQMAAELDELGDDDFLEVMANLAERHHMDIREKNTTSITTFTEWLSKVLYEIRDKEED